jgi:uncharacterized cupredoxin-like copper-binding protein
MCGAAPLEPLTNVDETPRWSSTAPRSSACSAKPRPGSRVGWPNQGRSVVITRRPRSTHGLRHNARDEGTFVPLITDEGPGRFRDRWSENVEVTSRHRLLGTAALLVSSLAGLGVSACGGSEPEPLDVATSSSLEVTATEMAYTPSEVAVDAGQVAVTLHNEGTTMHDLRIGEEPFILEAIAGETVSKMISLEAGRYELYCSLAGHSEAGMVGTLEVR